jgi:hypothetical protein
MHKGYPTFKREMSHTVDWNVYTVPPKALCGVELTYVPAEGGKEYGEPDCPDCKPGWQAMHDSLKAHNERFKSRRT